MEQHQVPPTQTTDHPGSSGVTSASRRRLLGRTLKAAPVVVTAASLSALSTRAVAAGTLCMSMNLSNPERKVGETCDVPAATTDAGSFSSTSAASPSANPNPNAKVNPNALENANPNASFNRVTLPPSKP